MSEFDLPMPEGLTFDDVLLVPGYADFLPGDCDLTTRLTRGVTLNVPLVSAAMDTVTEAGMAIALARLGGLGIIHRNMTVERQAAEVASAKAAGPYAIEEFPLATRDRQGRLLVGAAVGVGGAVERARALLEAGADVIAIDTAHGHTRGVIETLRALKAEFNGIEVIAGNIATAEAAQALIDAGADALKVGIGPGCFAAGTRVLMANATYKDIEAVVPGDRVINREGKPVTVVKSWCTGTREVMAIRHTASFRETMATPDHQYLLGDLSTTRAATVTSAGYASVLEKPTRRGENKIGWREIGEADRAVCLLPRRIQFELPPHLSIDLHDFAIRKEKQLARYHTAITDSYALGFMFGAFLGDGHAFIAKSRNSVAGRVSWYIDQDEDDVVENLCECIEAVVGKKPECTLVGRVVNIHLYSLQWARLFAQFGKRHEKHLPASYMCGNPRYHLGLYEGLLASDGLIAADGRRCFKNTSPQLAELFGVVCFLTEGSFPNTHTEPPSAGGQRQLDDYLIIKLMERRALGVAVPVYDIEVDCPTHSFIADNAIVHNSICTTRIVAGVGVPQLSAIKAVTSVARAAGVPIIADGGIRYSGDLTKAIAAGADCVMIGSLFARTHEAPGQEINFNGRIYKIFRGMGSIGALQSEDNDRYGKHSGGGLVPEGIEGMVPLAGGVDDVAYQLLGGLTKGMGYCGLRTVPALQAGARFIRVSGATVRESHPHDVMITKEAPNYARAPG